MKIRKRLSIYIIFSMIAFVSIYFGTFLIYNSIRSSQYQNIIEENKITLDRDYDWIEKGLNLDVWLTNGSDIGIKGTMVFLIKLDHSQLDPDFLFEEAEKEGFGKGLIEYLDKRNIESSKAEAVLNFIKRGNRLPDSLTYEPCKIKPEDDSIYVFKLYKEVKLNPGELQHINFIKGLPGWEVGYKCSVNIEAVKSKKWFFVY